MGPKGELLRTVADTMDAQAGVRQQWERIRATEDPGEMIRFGVQIVRGFADDVQAGRLMEAIQAAAPTEPAVAELMAEGMRRHRAGTRGLVEYMGQEGHLRAGVDVERGGAIFAVVTHPAVWRSLRAEHGWSLDAVEDWMTATLAAQLLADG